MLHVPAKSQVSPLNSMRTYYIYVHILALSYKQQEASSKKEDKRQRIVDYCLHFSIVIIEGFKMKSTLHPKL